MSASPVTRYAVRFGRGFCNLLGSLICAFFFDVSAAVSPAQSQGEPGEPRPGVGDLRRSLDQFLEVLEANRLLPQDSAANRQRAFEALMSSLRIPAELEQAPQAVGETGPDGSSALRASGTVGGRFVRVWIERVGGNLRSLLESQLADDLAHGHYSGIAIDLRQASGDGLESAAAASDYLGDFGLPLVVLVDGQTAGGAERLAVELRRRSGALILGQPTRGMPFATFTTALPSGELVRLPKIDLLSDAESTWKQEPVLPDVTMDAALPPPSAKAPGTTALWQEDPVEGDACLRRAVDLLTTIEAMGG